MICTGSVSALLQMIPLTMEAHRIKEGMIARIVDHQQFRDAVCALLRQALYMRVAWCPIGRQLDIVWAALGPRWA